MAVAQRNGSHCGGTNRPSPGPGVVAQQTLGRYHRAMAISPTDLPSLDERATQAYAHLFQALGEPTRLAVLQHLASGEHRVRDLVGHMELAQSTVSKHLSFLAQCGLVRARPEGRATWYSLTHPRDLAGLIAAAEQLLHVTGTRATLCSHLHHPPADQEPLPDGPLSGAVSGHSDTGAPLTGAAPAPTTPRQESL